MSHLFITQLATANPFNLFSSNNLTVKIAFFTLAFLCIAGAFVTITRKNLISAVMAMIGTFFSIAGIYAMLSAHFLAVIQVLVYAGGIMVLFVFVIMVLNHDEAEPWTRRGIFTKVLGVGMVSFLTMNLARIIYQTTTSCDTSASVTPSFGTLKEMGRLFFSPNSRYLFPFEALSLLLLIAIVGALVLARGYVARPTSVYETPNELETELPKGNH